MTRGPALPPHFAYRGARLVIENTPVEALVAQHGTPLYVYSKAALLERHAAYAGALAARGRSRDDATVCYAVKANSNLAILRLFARAGAGFDIVSGGELERVLAAGGDASTVIFSGVGKTRDEMSRALDVGIRCFNVESTSEIAQLAAVARDVGKRAPVSLRINPDVDAKTHPYISTGLRESKFGIAYADALDAYRRACDEPSLDVRGVDCHIGSQLLDDAPLVEALDKLLELIDRLDAAGIALEHLDLGGGIGILYGDEAAGQHAIDVSDHLARVVGHVDRWQAERPTRRRLKLLFEPGRSLVGNAGALIARVLVLKPGEAKNFAVVDAAMNDLIRPSLYDAWHDVVPVRTDAPDVSTGPWEIVGPICESGDWLAKDRALALGEGDLVAFLSAGAYGMTMASNYNTRPRAAEVLVDGTSTHLIRRRETLASLFADERIAE